MSGPLCSTTVRWEDRREYQYWLDMPIICCSKCTCVSLPDRCAAADTLSRTPFSAFATWLCSPAADICVNLLASTGALSIVDLGDHPSHDGLFRSIHHVALHGTCPHILAECNRCAVL